MSDKPSPPHLVAALTEVLRKVIPNAGDHVTRCVLRLFPRNTGLSFEAFVGPLFEVEELGWIKVSGETHTTTPEGAREFASGTTVVVDRKADAVAETKPTAKASKRRKR